MSARCQVAKDVCEERGPIPCAKPAAYVVANWGHPRDRELDCCERHAHEALRDGATVATQDGYDVREVESETALLEAVTT